MININGTITNQKTVEFLQKECTLFCWKCKYIHLCMSVFGQTHKPNSDEAEEMVDNAIEFNGCENDIVALARVK